MAWRQSAEGKDRTLRQGWSGGPVLEECAESAAVARRLVRRQHGRAGPAGCNGGLLGNGSLEVAQTLLEDVAKVEAKVAGRAFLQADRPFQRPPAGLPLEDDVDGVSRRAEPARPAHRGGLDEAFEFLVPHEGAASPDDDEGDQGTVARHQCARVAIQNGARHQEALQRLAPCGPGKAQEIVEDRGAHVSAAPAL